MDTNQKDIQLDINQGKTNLKEYSSPTVSDYGKMSELTKAISGSVGCDGAYPSYTAS